MTNLRQAAQQALEALMKSHTHPLLPDDCEAAITALKQALAEPEQEPVAYSIGRTLHWHDGKGVDDAQLFAAPTPRKPLSLDEIEALLWDGEKLRTNVEYARAIEIHHGITGEQT